MEIQSETIYFSKVMDPLRGNFMLLNLGRKIIKFAFQTSFLKSNNTLKYGLVWVTEVHPVYQGKLNLQRDEMLPLNCHFCHVP